MPNQEVAALEAIGFQIDKSVVNQLIELFRQPYIYLAKLDNEEIERTPKNLYMKHEKLGIFCKELFNTELKAILKKSFNVNLNETIIETPKNSFTGMAMTIKGDKDADQKKIFTSMDRLAYQGVKKSDLKTIRKLNKGFNDIDYLKGEMIKKSDTAFSFVFIFNLPMTYLADRVLIFPKPIREKASLTPEEITAVFLHELGHFFTITEYSLGMIYTGFYGNHILKNQISTSKKDLINVSLKKTDKNFEKDKIKKIKEINKLSLSLINESKKTTISNKKANKYIKDTLKKVENSIDEIDDSETEMFSYSKTAKIALIITEIYAKLILIAAIIFFPYTLALVYTINTTLSLLEYNDRNSSTLSKEIYTGARGYAIFERVADEFVARMGMEKYLASSLVKVSKNIMATNLLGSSYSMLDPVNSGISSFILRGISFGNYVVISILRALLKSESSDSYENFKKRLLRLSEDKIALLKNSNLNIKLKAQSIKEYEDTAKIAKISNELPKLVMPIEKLNEITRYIIRTPEKAVFGFTTKDAIKLVDSFDALLSNQAYYYSAKFDVLFNK